MKQIENLIKETYSDGEFIIEISDTGELWDVYISHSDYGIKMKMFGLLKDRQSYADVVKIVEANLPEYERQYNEEFMD